MTTKLLGAASNRRSLKTRQSPPACVKGERPLHVAVYCYSQNESEVRIKDELEFCDRFAAGVLPEVSIEHVVDIGRGRPNAREFIKRTLDLQVGAVVVKNLTALNRYPQQAVKFFALLLATDVPLYAANSGEKVDVQRALINAWFLADTWKRRCQSIAARRRASAR
jgi:hypothetical protein